MAQKNKDIPGADGRARVIIEGVDPEIDCGRFAAKRTVGDEVVVEADIFTDGHDRVQGLLLYRHARQRKWREAPMEPLVNDRWRGTFEASELGHYHFTVLGWVDPFGTWRRDLAKRMAAGQDVSVDLRIGAAIVEGGANRASGRDAERLQEGAARLRTAAGETDPDAGSLTELVEDELDPLMLRHADRTRATRYPRELSVEVDRERARFSAWYELFPRSTGEGGKHGTFRDVEKVLPYVREMGFDVLYLPPIHPIGRENRKGPNNVEKAGRGDPGSPWAIGAREGGHRAIHPELGTLEDFRRLREKAEEHGLEIALDIAFQTAPDHPLVGEHPQWFRKRPDGTVQYAENPPKKYQDIYPFDFESEAWRELWEELRDVFLHWIGEGVKIFRVDNPHTKPFSFWEWVIRTIRAEHPDVLFLSEAFTRPKVMYRLAKLGFTQSYTYFAWRNTKHELIEYMTELTRSEAKDFFRPSFWPNTPDILNEYLQTGGRPAFAVRLVLAATLSSSYGIYGPAFELMEHVPREEGSEEYRDSEKYQIREWDLEREDSLRHLIRRVNTLRRRHAALQRNETLRFHPVDNDEILCYSKTDPKGKNPLLVVVNLDPHHRQSGWLDLHLEELGLEAGESYRVHDLLGDEWYLWHGSRNYVELNPHVLPAHLLQIHPQVRTERDFEYYE